MTTTDELQSTPAQRDAGTSVRARMPPTVLDVSVALAATAGAIAVSFSSRELGTHSPDLVAVALLIASGLALTVRRRWPVGVLLTVVAATSLYLALDHPGGAELPLLMVGLYTTVAEDRRAIGLAVFAGILVWHSGYRLLADQEEPLLVAVTASLLVLVVALGEATRLRRELHDEAQERLRAVEHEKTHEARAYVTAERLRLARELHDVLAHTITAITVQAGALADGLDPNEEARAALRSIRTTSREAMRQLEATITILRTETPDAAAVPGIRDLQALTDSVQRTSGVPVRLRVGDDVGVVPAATELAAYRLVQESLTNVIRHADATHAEVVVERRAGQLVVRVVDDGVGPGSGDGFGLVGMRERAQALGGRFHAGADDGGGFVVQASLPLEDHAG